MRRHRRVSSVEPTRELPTVDWRLALVSWWNRAARRRGIGPLAVVLAAIFCGGFGAFAALPLVLDQRGSQAVFKDPEPDVLVRVPEAVWVADLPLSAIGPFLSRERRQIDAAVDRTVERALWMATFELDPLFRDLDVTLPALVDWVFGWWTTYAVAKDGLGAATGDLVLRGNGDVGASFVAGVDATVRRAFQTHTLVPARADARMEALVSRLLGFVRAEADAHAARGVDVLVRVGRPFAGPEFMAVAGPLPAPAFEPASELISASGASDQMLVRLNKLFISRAIYLGLVTSGSLGAITIGGAEIVGAVAGVGTGWSIDYVVHRADDVLHRSDLLRILRAQLAADRRRIEDRLAEALRDAAVDRVRQTLPWYTYGDRMLAQR